MKKLLTLLIILFLWTGSSWGQLVTIGSGTNTGYLIPVNSNYGYTYSQQIVLQSEIARAGQITKLNFYMVGGISLSSSNNWTIYLGHTTKTSFSSNSDWVPLASMTQVYTGTIAATPAAGWYEITLTAGFNYNNTDNLVVAIDENASGYNLSTNYVRIWTTPVANRAIHYRSDGTNPDPAVPPTANGRLAYINQMQLYFLEPPCSGTPTPGNTIASENPVCGGTNFTLSLQNSTPGTGVTYQWQSSTTGGAPWTNLGTASIQTTSQTVATWYQCLVTCSGNTGTSNPLLVTLNVGATPYNEGFLTTTTPACWNITGWTIGSTRGVTGNPGNNIYKNLYSSVATGTYTTGLIGLVSTGMLLTFDYKLADYSSPYAPPASGSGNFVVSVSTDGTNFTPLETVANNGTAGWQSKSYNLDAYNGYNILIRFVGNWTSGDYDLAFDNIKIESPPSCLSPTGVTSGSVMATSANILWTASSSNPSGGYDIYYSTSSTAPTSGSTPNGSVGAGVTTYATGNVLSANTTYYAWVRSNCSGDYSPWASGGSFKTLCDAVSIPITENFNSVTTPNLPDCWSKKIVSTSSANVVTTTTYHSSPNGVYMSNSGDAASEVYLISPAIVQNLNTVRVKLWAYSYSTYPVKVGVMTDPTNASTFVEMASYATSGTWTERVTDFNSYAGSGVYVAVKFVGTSTYQGVYVDDITIEALPTCLEPTAINITNITATSSSINWTASTSTPSGGYDVYYSTSSTAPNSGTTPSGSVLAGVTTYSTGNVLSANTTYYAWVRSNCGGGDLSGWAGYTSFYTGYCIPSATSVDGTGITNVTFGNSPNIVNNTTSNETNNYGNYSAMIGDVIQGATATIAITFNTSTYDYNTKIWIDLNNDLDFADSGEEVYSGLSGSTSPNTLNASVTIPGATSIGNHRMRIGGGDDAAPGPCTTGATYTCFEDYTVNVVAPLLPVISGLSAPRGCTGSSLIISGTDLAGATQVTIGGTTAVITANSATEITVTVGNGTSGFVAVTTLAGTATSTDEFSVNPLPVVYTVSGDGGYCAGSTGTSIILSGSESDVDYTLSTSPVTILSGTGSSLTFGPTAFATGAYTISAAYTTTGCSQTMTGSVNVTVNPIPSSVIATASSNAVCTGSAVNLTSSAVSNADNIVNYTQGFETWPPTGWTFINAGSGNQWATNSSFYTGSKSMAYTFSSTFAANAWGMTQGITLNAGTVYTVSFWYKVALASYPEKLKVTVGSAATVVAQSNVLWNNNGGSNLTNTTWAQGTATYTAPTTGTYYFGFNCYSDADQDVLYVDDISITGTTILPATYSWTSSPSGFTSSTQNPTGIIPTVATDYTVIAQNSFGCTASASTGVVTINPLPTITLTSSALLIAAGNTTGTLTYSGTTNGADTYSIDFDAAANAQGFVDVNNLPFSGGTLGVTIPAGAGATDYNATLTVRNSTTGCVSNAYPIVITVAGFAFTTTQDIGTTLKVTWTSQPSAYLYAFEYRVAGNTPWLGISAPTNTVKVTNLLPNTNYECHVRIYKNGVLWGYSQIGTFTTANVTYTKTQDIGTTALMSWNSFAFASGYTLQYRKIGTPTWVSVASATNSAKMTNLLPNTDYECQVRVNVSNTLWGTCQLGTFHTGTMGFSTSQDIGTTLLMSWTPVSWASNVTLQYRPLGGSSWTAIGTTAGQVKVGNLQADSDYEFRLYVYKSGLLYGVSAISTIHTGAVAFTTVVDNNTSMDLTWLPSMTSWATSYQMQYCIGSENPAVSWVSMTTSSNTTLSIFPIVSGQDYWVKMRVMIGGVLWGTTKEQKIGRSTKEITVTENSQSETGMNVYPNPFVEQINMAISTTKETSCSWLIYDMTGKVVIQGTQSLSEGENTFNIEASGLTKGVYLLNVLTDSGKQSFRIVKQ
jgi:hypothetical protein